MPVLEGGLELANFSVPVKRSKAAENLAVGTRDQVFHRRQKRPADTAADDLNTKKARLRTTGDRPVISSLFKSNPVPTSDFLESQGQVDSEPSNAPKASSAFEELGLEKRIVAHLKKLEINAPTAIQKAAIPALVNSHSDAFIQAETGSGKTYAYLLPILHQIIALSATKQVHRDSGLFAIILVPTRELTKQISATLEALLRCANWIVCGTVSGGESKQSEKARLRKGVNILVATPGRLADHMVNTKSLDPSSVRWLVLDEGDRLMELGFEEDIRKILKFLDWRLRQPKEDVLENLPSRRVNILCSATMKGDVQALGDISLKDAELISAEPDEGNETASVSKNSFKVPAQLKQSFLVVPSKLRLVSLVGLLKNIFARCQSSTKIIVFFSCADSVDFHFKALSRSDSEKPAPEPTPKQRSIQASKRPQKHGRLASEPDLAPTSASSAAISSNSHAVTAFRLHGSLQQAVRSSTLKEFSQCKTPAVLLCTDIAARGLDLPHVDRVIEFDPAFSREEHLHRVGRTARAGNEGAATVFLLPGCEEGYVKILNEDRSVPGSVPGQSADHVLKLAFGTTTTVDTSSLKTSDPKWEDTATDLQLDFERWTLSTPTLLESARKAFKSHVRAYATHVKDERQYFDIKDLHLGHLAKAFALRDRPGNVNVPGLRSTARTPVDTRKKKKKTTLVKEMDAEVVDEIDIAVSRKEMSNKAKMMERSIEEFNLA
jgi:ATP-dependent RNA helicase DDX31/DBP7